MNTLTAIYARVSSERQKEEKTIESQTCELKEFAQAQNYVVPESWVFEDEGYSGATLARPGLERLRDLVSEGQVEIVLVHSPDRLSRRYAYQVLLLEEFSRQGVEVRFLKGNAGQTPEEQLLVQFQGMIAEYERAQITERCRRGKRHRAKIGSVNVLSGAPYGYRYLKKTEGSDSCYVIDENEVPVVRQVYQWYTECHAREIRLRKRVFEFSKDRICRSGPSKGFGIFVVLGEVGVNGGLKFSHRREASPTDGLGGDTGKETLDHVEPGAASRSEVKMEARMA